MGLPAGGGRHELHCGLRDGAPVGAVLYGFPAHPSGPAGVSIPRLALRALIARRGRVATVLGGSLVDVPPKAAAAHLNGTTGTKSVRRASTSSGYAARRRFLRPFTGSGRLARNASTCSSVTEQGHGSPTPMAASALVRRCRDRKSTRLNSSHLGI